MTETGHEAAPGAVPHPVRRACRPALTGLLVVAAVWLTWWVAATIADRTGHAEDTYLVVFVGGPFAALVTLVVLLLTGARLVDNLCRGRRAG
jgi:hypothetical protein